MTIRHSICFRFFLDPRTYECYYELFIAEVIIMGCHEKIKPQETVQSFSLRSGDRIRYKKVRFRIKHPSCVLLKDDGMICTNVKSNTVLTKEEA